MKTKTADTDNLSARSLNNLIFKSRSLTLQNSFFIRYNKSPLKWWKWFVFHFKVVFVLGIFTFLSWIFGYVEKWKLRLVLK